ncbi:hypothetical protein LJC02_04780 [Breznakia sp. OttesenSCG-928-G09]|nr:hypothetical protein [Breznakia sp. OttesenSCG-928-G09]
MLMATKRPMFVKQRIIGDFGHLCNEDSANVLAELVGKKTKEIVLAHISEEGNSKERAKAVLLDTLQAKQIDTSRLRIISAPQFEIVRGGNNSK